MNKRKDQLDNMKRKQTQKQQSLDSAFDNEISALIPYLKIMPPSIQSKFVIPIKQMLGKQTINQINSSLVEKMLSSFSVSEISDPSKYKFLTELFCRFLKLNKLKQGFSNVTHRSSSKQKQNDTANDRNYSNASFQPFEPNIQRQMVKFAPMAKIINPNYENIIKMYKTFTDMHMNMEYKIQDLNENYTFFSQPRFISKVLQMRDFQSSFPEKGNIVMMSFEGSKITGKRGFAFINRNAIYWWEKNYKDIKDILPQISQQKEGKDKDKKKDYERQEIKNQAPEASKLIQNFKLSYKMIGHNGKITSLSLSDDEYYLLSAGSDKTIKLWDLRQKCLLAQYRGHMKTIWSVDFSKSGYFFLSGSADKTVKLWSTDDSICQRVYIGHEDDVIKVEFMKNPDLIASASEDRTIRIWNTLTANCMNTFKFDRSPLNFKNSISGRYFAVCDTSGKVSVYDLLKGELISCFMVPQKQQSDSGHVNYLKIHNMCFSMDEKQFTCVSSKYIVIYSFDKISQKQSKSLFIDAGRQSKQKTVATKEVIYTGRDSNLVYCDYHDKGVLVVATTTSKKY